jgi:DNA-directed RNA polymerase subunit N (RpoN/RPB10)
MTIRQFIAMIGEAETGGLKNEDERLRSIGDGGLAGGYYQQHWKWRIDNWPAWAWSVLRMLDRLGLENYCAKRSGMTAHQLADLYNLGHLAPDPQYDKRCQSGLATLELPLTTLEEVLWD